MKAGLENLLENLRASALDNQRDPLVGSLVGAMGLLVALFAMSIAVGWVSL